MSSNILPFLPSGSFYHKRAERQLNQSEYCDAAHSYRMAVEREPDNSDYRMELALYLARLGLFDASTDQLMDVYGHTQGLRRDCLYWVADNFYNLYELDIAQQYAEMYLQLEPRGEYAGDCRELISLCREEKAGEDFVSFSPEATAALSRAEIAYTAGHFRASAKHLEQAIALGASTPEIRCALAHSLKDSGQYDRAEQEIRSLLEEDSRNVQALCALAMLMAADGRDNSVYLRRAEMLGGEAPEDIRALCELFAATDDLPALRLWTGRLLEWEPYDYMNLYLLGVISYRMGEYREALDMFTRAEKLFPFYPPFRYAMRAANACLQGEEPMPLNYLPELPEAETDRLLDEIRDIALNGDSGRARWRDDEVFRGQVIWAMSEYRDMSPLVMALLGLYNDSRAVHALRLFALNRQIPDDEKSMAVLQLARMGVPQPIPAHLEGRIVQVGIKKRREEDETHE